MLRAKIVLLLVLWVLSMFGIYFLSGIPILAGLPFVFGFPFLLRSVRRPRKVSQHPFFFATIIEAIPIIVILVYLQTTLGHSTGLAALGDFDTIFVQQVFGGLLFGVIFLNIFLMGLHKKIRHWW